ncbi:hypothetical protein PMAYCL1PPCAC_18590, partial [Pristionchus mayeri]
MSKEWIEGVVTSVDRGRVFITFKHCSTICQANRASRKLALGDVVDICVVPAKDEDCFNIVDIGDKIRKRADLIVEPFETTKCSVFCDAKVIDRCTKRYFVLDTPVIGLAFFLLKDAPREMEVGDVWRVKMLRRKEKKSFPSYWMAIDVTGDCPRIWTASIRSNEKNGRDSMSTSGYSSSSPQSFLHTPDISQDIEWTTVMITGSDDYFWFGASAPFDCVSISQKLNRSGNKLERGAFHRVKCTKAHDGAIKASILDPHPLYPTGFHVDVDLNQLK